MTHHKVTGHFIPHVHDDGQRHPAHALSLISLFVYLQLFLIFTFGLYFIGIKAPHILGTISFSADQIISLTNTKRQDAGLPILSMNSVLASAALEKASDMFANNYWAHNSPSGKTPWSFISQAGYRYIYAGENLARDFNDAASVVNAWMNSPSHRSNLLDSNFHEIGVAVAGGKLNGREGILVVQMFGSRISQVPSEQPLAVASPKPESAGAVASPTSSPNLAASPSPEVAIAQLQVQEQAVSPSGSSQATVLATRQFSIAKGAALALVSFIFLLFALETIIATKRQDMHLRAGVIAHLGILGFVLLAVWYAAGGAII